MAILTLVPVPRVRGDAAGAAHHGRLDVVQLLGRDGLVPVLKQPEGVLDRGPELLGALEAQLPAQPAGCLEQGTRLVGELSNLVAPARVRLERLGHVGVAQRQLDARAGELVGRALADEPGAGLEGVDGRIGDGGFRLLLLRLGNVADAASDAYRVPQLDVLHLVQYDCRAVKDFLLYSKNVPSAGAVIYWIDRALKALSLVYGITQLLCWLVLSPGILLKGLGSIDELKCLVVATLENSRELLRYHNFDRNSIP